MFTLFRKSEENIIDVFDINCTSGNDKVDEYVKVDNQEDVKVDDNEDVKVDEQEDVKVDNQEDVKVDDHEDVKVDDHEDVKVDDHEDVKVDDRENVKVDDNICYREDIEYENNVDEYDDEYEDDYDPDNDLFVISIDNEPFFYTKYFKYAQNKIWEMAKNYSRVSILKSEYNNSYKSHIFEKNKNTIKLVNYYDFILFSYPFVSHELRISRVRKVI